ncbi:MAG: tetratricopeptide repeat protein [Spirosomataceae bacterium]
MKTLFLSAFLLFGLQAAAQYSDTGSPLDGRNLGIVSDHPDMKKVVIKNDITYLSDAKGTLKLDVYLPPQLKPNEKRPVVVFLNAIGDHPRERKLKSWATYTTWPQLVAAHGYIGISMEADRERIQESLQGVFDFLAKESNDYHVNSDKIGVYAASANVSQSVQYLMKESAYKGIKAAVLYYGNAPAGPFRKDLPVLFFVSEGDVRGDNYASIWGEVLKNKAPWTLVMGSDMPHAFDTFTSNEESRKIIKQTLSFWKDHLEPVASFADPNPDARAILAARYGHNPVKAAELLKPWTAQHPSDPIGLSMYGSVLKDLKKYDEAGEIYQKLLALQPTNGEALVSLALLAYMQNKPSEAEGFITKAITANPESRDLYANLGFNLLSLGKWSESVKYYEKATKIEPTGFDFYNLACAYSLLKDNDRALNALEQAMKYGSVTKQQFDNDTDFDSVRSDERFKKLFEQKME